MKLYFRQDEDEFCTTIEAHREYMRENDINELAIYEAKRTTGTGYFWCTHFHGVGEVGEGCGKECEAYSPRNGKNGRCRYSGYLYEQTEKKRILTASGHKIKEMDDDIICIQCGSSMYYEDCWSCGGEGGRGWEDLQFEDPLWYSPDSFIGCDVCNGKGGF